VDLGVQPPLAMLDLAQATCGAMRYAIDALRTAPYGLIDALRPTPYGLIDALRPTNCALRTAPYGLAVCRNGP
jgi:hypothetical protein